MTILAAETVLKNALVGDLTTFVVHDAWAVNFTSFPLSYIVCSIFRPILISHDLRIIQIHHDSEALRASAGPSTRISAPNAIPLGHLALAWLTTLVKETLESVTRFVHHGAIATRLIVIKATIFPLLKRHSAPNWLQFPTTRKEKARFRSIFYIVILPTSRNIRY